jgi:hypothetical protein
MRASPATTIIFTTAPADYDWFFTIEIAAHVGTTANGKAVRKVEIEAGRVEEQCDRYASGCHMAVDETEWRKLIEHKLAIMA